MNKTENTLENKAKFFALYYKQTVLKTTDDEHESVGNYLLTLNNPFMSLIENDKGIYYLELTPLSQITDEDAIDVAQILTRFKWSLDLGTKVVKEGNQVTVYYDELKGGFKHKTIIYDDLFSRNYTGEPAKPMCGNSFDFLRSKGYALPWMDLSVEDLVSYGWVKLKS